MTSTFIKESNAIETEEVFLSLLTFTHPDMPEVLRFVDNTKEIVSNGETFLPYPFTIVLPDDKDGVLPQVKLSIDNVDKRLTTAIRGFSNPPIVTLQIILASSPDRVEIRLDHLKLRNVTFDAFTIEASLVIDSPMSRRFPASTYNPKQFLALFYR